MRLHLGLINADSEIGRGRIVVNADDAAAILEEVLEEGEMSLLVSVAY